MSNDIRRSARAGVILPLLLLVGCSSNEPSCPAPGRVHAMDKQSLSDARIGFKTRLIRRTSDGQPVPTPPDGMFQIAQYYSGPWKLAAYLTPDPNDGKKHPAIVWITSDCNSIGAIWEEPRPGED